MACPHKKERLTDEFAAEDTALVELAQQGDDRAFAMLVARCEPMLRAQVARFRSPYADAEDMQQEGLLGLLAAVRTFRADGGAAFRTYAAVCVRNRLLSAVRRYAAQGAEQQAMPPEAWLQSALDPAARVLEQESAALLLTQLQERLTAREYAVFLRYLDGFSYAEIGDTLQLSLKSVDNTLQRVRRKLATQFSKQIG
jgi:RNA polymerase sporulation-specific sigma factor